MQDDQVWSSTFWCLFRSARTSYRAFDPVRDNFPSSPPPPFFSFSFFSSFCPVTPGHPCHPAAPPVTPVVVVVAKCHPEGRASCKCSLGWPALLQMIIRTDWPFANGQWSFRWTSLLWMIIRMDRPLADDRLDQLDSSPFFLLFFSKFIIFLKQTPSSPS